MDPQRDTPIKRFSALWVGLFVALSFMVATIVLSKFVSNNDVQDEVLQSEYDVRLRVKAEVDKAQKAALTVDPKTAFGYTSKQLLEGKPTKTNQIVPGSPTDIKQNTVK